METNVIFSFDVNREKAKQIFFHNDKELIARFNVIPTGRSPKTTRHPGTFASLYQISMINSTRFLCFFFS